MLLSVKLLEDFGRRKNSRWTFRIDTREEQVFVYRKRVLPDLQVNDFGIELAWPLSVTAQFPYYELTRSEYHLRAFAYAACRLPRPLLRCLTERQSEDAGRTLKKMRLLEGWMGLVRDLIPSDSYGESSRARSAVRRLVESRSQATGAFVTK